jgi:iron-sulfur cluster assembly protein
MEYTMEYASEQQPHEDAVEDKGVKILIETMAILFLLVTELDYWTESFTPF